jgi:hypothetical protein
MIDREEVARVEAVKEFEKRNPDYIKLDSSPDKELIEWAYEQKISFPIIVGGVKFVAPGTVEQARMWKGKLSQ